MWFKIQKVEALKALFSLSYHSSERQNRYVIPGITNLANTNRAA